MAASISSNLPRLSMLCGNGMFEVLGANILFSLGAEKESSPIYAELYPMVGQYMHLCAPTIYPDISNDEFSMCVKIFRCDIFDNEQLDFVSRALQNMASDFDVAVPLVGIAWDVPRPLDYAKTARAWAELIETVLRFRREARPRGGLSVS